MRSRNSIIYAQIITNLFIILCLACFPVHAEAIYIKNYIVDLLCLLVVVLLLALYISKRGFDIFDPIWLITFFYVFLYYVTPCYDIVIKKYLWFGYEMFPYGVKASLISLAGYVSFYCFYYGGRERHRGIVEQDQERAVQGESSEGETRIVLAVIIVFYLFSFAANFYYLMHSGYGNALYILTMGLAGTGNNYSEKQEAIGYVAMFSYCLPTLVLLHWKYSRSKGITLLLFVMMLMMQITRGFRFFIVQIAISFAAYYYVSNGRKPKLRHLIALLAVISIPVLLMTFFRDEIRRGYGTSLSVLAGQSLSKAFDDIVWDNFRIYNNFYGMVNAIPQKYGFVYGRQIIIGTLVMMIPRAIWPGKISSAAGMGLAEIVGERLYRTGQAYPGLGEYYYAFGISGVIFFMGIYGIWMRHARDRFMQPGHNDLNVIKYAVLLGMNVQLLIRGYTPSNFWYLIFSLIPIYLVSYVESHFKHERISRGEESNGRENSKKLSI